MKTLKPADSGWVPGRVKHVLGRLATCRPASAASTWLLVVTLPVTAAAAEGGNTNPLSINPDLAIFTAIIFVLLLVVLGRFAWRPLMDGLDTREKAINDMIETAKRGTEEAEKKLQLYEQKLAAAATEAHELVNQARKDAESAGEKLLTQAREQADRERKQAMEDIHAAKNAAVKEIADQSADIAFSLAQKLIHRELTPDDHRALVRETLDQFPSQT